MKSGGPLFNTSDKTGDSVNRPVTSKTARRLGAVLTMALDMSDSATDAEQREFADRTHSKHAKRAEKNRSRYASDPAFRARCVAASRRDRVAYPLANRARRDVSNAIHRGDLLPAASQRCVDCGARARDYDHRDYTKPLEVVPVCRPCNKRRGPGHPYA